MVVAIYFCLLMCFINCILTGIYIGLIILTYHIEDYTKYKLLKWVKTKGGLVLIHSVLASAFLMLAIILFIILKLSILF